MTMHGGPLNGYQPPSEQRLPDDWSYLGTDDQVHRYVRSGDTWNYQGATDLEPAAIVEDHPDSSAEPTDFEPGP